MGRLFAPIILWFKMIMAYGIWILLAFVGVIILLILAVAIATVEIGTFGLLNFLLFGIKPGQSIVEYNTSIMWVRFLIVSGVLWALMFFITLTRFSFQSADKAHVFIRSVFLTSLKWAFILIIFNLTLLGFNWVVQKITALIFGGGNSVTVSFINNIARSVFPPQIHHLVPPLLKEVPNATLVPFSVNFSFLSFGNFKAMFYELDAKGVAAFTWMLLSGLLLIISGIAIGLPLLKGILDLLGKTFYLYFLYLIFPFILPLSTGDGGKKATIWREKYVSNLLSITVFLIGLKVFSSMMLAIPLFFAVIAGGSASSLPIGQAMIASIMTLLIYAGTAYAFPKLSDLIISFFGADVSDSAFKRASAQTKGAYDIATKKSKQEKAQALEDKKQTALAGKIAGAMKGEE